MAKITFMGAGSTVFAKNVLGDCMCREALKDSHIALYDINKERLIESEKMLTTLNQNINGGRAKITTHLGVANRKKALKGADFVVNAIQVGGYEPSTVIDFEIPKNTAAPDHCGHSRHRRYFPCAPHDSRNARFCKRHGGSRPNAWFLNYTNPMAMLTGAMLRGTSVKTVGLCHSVQVCAQSLLMALNLYDEKKDGPF